MEVAVAVVVAVMVAVIAEEMVVAAQAAVEGSVNTGRNSTDPTAKNSSAGEPLHLPFPGRCSDTYPSNGPSTCSNHSPIGQDYTEGARRSY